MKGKLLMMSCVLGTSLLVSSSVFAKGNVNISRLAGQDRYGTSNAVVSQGWTQSDYAVLVNSENFPDAITSAPLAKKYNAPILLTDTNRLTDSTKQKIQDLQIKNVFIVGGSGVVSSNVETELKGMGISVKRIWGQDRYETSVNVAKELGTFKGVFVVNGEYYEDALSAAPIAAKLQYPIILVEKNNVPDMVKKYINNQVGTNNGEIEVIGGQDVLDGKAVSTLNPTKTYNQSTKYERNLALINNYKTQLDLNKVYIASDKGFADALSGSALAGKDGNPIILIGDSNEKDVNTFISNNNVENVNALGGTGVLSDNVVNIVTGNASSTADEDSDMNLIKGNLFVNSTSSDFMTNAASLEDVEISNNIGDGAVILKSDKLKGVYTSNIISTSPFNYFVPSWDSDTPEGTSIQLEARVFVKNKWSNWLSWGSWGTFIKRASGSGVTDDPAAYVDTDTLTIKGTNGETSSKIQYRVTLNTNKSGVTPSVRLISGTIRNTLSGQEINKVFSDNPDLSSLKVLDVPQFSQMVREPSIANSICSATSIAMILNYYGTNIVPEQSAWGVYDYKYDGFGNWPFNTAYASSFGYKTYVDYSTVEGLKREIYYGHPVAVSVQYKNNVNVKANLPVVDGAPIESTYGHLIVVCGFTKENGTDYIIINDSAASNNDRVRVKYRLDQFKEAWAKSGNIAYIIHEKENGAGYRAPVKLEGELDAVSGSNDEYMLKYNGDTIDISSNNVKTIMMTSDGGKTYKYIVPSKKSTITKNSSGTTASINYTFITGEGKVYSAEIK
ncbi:cell wall-binding repeat-containing protein [Clostridium sp. PL3]|uniref:Cell wall-binding repeat-containing protein n=1 Tax=Clostridium thailandense TaxID=2794346 RepID=A0A949WR20_9CLOT|nr:cell wall-binding repeat-containing protein [Clostridium thailandense]MBV7273456.1 cell wall-binding repeat-containing protein [Clostridium thailandense]